MTTTLSDIKSLDDLNALLDDPDLTEAINIVLKLIAKPDIPQTALSPTIVKLQAISAKLNMMAAVETHLYKTDRTRKNLLYSVRDSIDSVVAALKYATRV